MSVKKDEETLPVEELVEKAMKAMEMSYSPYSGFRVGACLLTSDGDYYTGCNIENAAYTPTNCAERTAFFKAVSEGRRDFTAIAVCGGPDGVIKDYCAPCGVCRQVMREFCNPSAFRILVAKSAEDYREYTLEQLLPDSFGPNDLEK